MFELSNLFNPFSEGSPLTALSDLLGDPSGTWDKFKNGRTNEVNKEIADENLEYQRERNKIEDARYEEETAYNRAWALDERNYNRTLQQQIFDREDTALERQAEQLSKLGINPLSQQMNGLGAGAVVGSASPATASARGGEALHNDFQMVDKGLMEAISPIMSLANGISNINTQGLQRDSLREQNDYQRLLNQEKALQNRFLENKLIQEEEARGESNRHEKAMNPSTEKNAKASAERNERENKFQNEFGVTDNTNEYVRMATDIAKQAERGKDYIEDKVGDVSKSALSALSQSATKKINNYKDYLKQGWENDKRRWKNFWKKVNDFGNKYL